MHVNVSGKGVDVGESLRAHAEKQLASEINKYIDRVTSVQAVVSREAHLFRVDITGHVGTHTGLVIRGRGEAADVYVAFDGALEKMGKQLRRYKRKLTNHHKLGAGAAAAAYQPVKATKYVIGPEAGEHEDDKASPVVIAEKTTQIETLPVSEAVMRMDLEDLPALLFHHSGTGRLNVVYRRADGNISWVDPQQ